MHDFTLNGYGCPHNRSIYNEKESGIRTTYENQWYYIVETIFCALSIMSDNEKTVIISAHDRTILFHKEGTVLTKRGTKPHKEQKKISIYVFPQIAMNISDYSVLEVWACSAGARSYPQSQCCNESFAHTPSSNATEKTRFWRGANRSTAATSRHCLRSRNGTLPSGHMFSQCEKYVACL